MGDGIVYAEYKTIEEVVEEMKYKGMVAVIWANDVEKIAADKAAMEADGFDGAEVEQFMEESEEIEEGD